MASVIKRTRRALAVAERWTPRCPGSGLEGLRQERSERAWRFLCDVTDCGQTPLPRFVNKGFVSAMFNVSPATAKRALGALKEQPKGQPWPTFASLEKQEGTTH